MSELAIVGLISDRHYFSAALIPGEAIQSVAGLCRRLGSAFDEFVRPTDTLTIWFQSTGRNR